MFWLVSSDLRGHDLHNLQRFFVYRSNLYLFVHKTLSIIHMHYLSVSAVATLLFLFLEAIPVVYGSSKQPAHPVNSAFTQWMTVAQYAQ